MGALTFPKKNGCMCLTELLLQKIILCVLSHVQVLTINRVVFVVVYGLNLLADLELFL